MRTNPATVASNPARDIGVHAWVWMGQHRKTSYVLGFMLVCTVCQVVLATPAWASSVFGLPTEDLTDSNGVPLARYTDLPFDEGGVTAPGRAGRYMIASLLWMCYAFVVIAVIAMADWILSFDWLEWIASPVVLFTNAIDDFLSGMGVVTVGALVACLIIAIGLLRGRNGTSFVEIGIVVIMFGLIATPAANPIEWVAGDDGWINQATDFGAQAGEELTTDDGPPGGGGGGTEDDSGSIVSGTIIDMTLREPMLGMSFGSDFTDTDECVDIWDERAADSDDDIDDIRSDVIDCDDSAEAANETSSFVFIGFLILGAITSVGILFLLATAIVFLIKEVVMALFGAINTLIKGYFALFPGGARYAFFNALMQTVVSVVMTGVYIGAMMAYLWLIEMISILLPALLGIGGLFFGILVLIFAVTFVLMKRQGKKIGQSIARALGRGGLTGSEGQQDSKKPSRLGTAVSHAGQRAGNAMHRGRMMRTMMTAGQTGAAVATGGTSAAAQVGTRMAAKQATKGAMVKAGKNAAAHKAGKTATQATKGAGTIARPPRPTAGVTGKGQGFSTTAPSGGTSATPAGPVSDLPPAGGPRGALPAGGERRGELPAPSKQSSEMNATHDRSMGPGELSSPRGQGQPPWGPQTSQNTSVGRGAASGLVGGESHSDALGARRASAARRSSLPPGRYGNMWVHKDGTATTVLKGESQSAPSKSKLDKAWTVASPEVPTARSKRPGRTGIGDKGQRSPVRAGPDQTPPKGISQPRSGRKGSSAASRNARTAETQARSLEQKRTGRDQAPAPQANSQRGTTQNQSQRMQKAHQERRQATRQRAERQGGQSRVQQAAENRQERGER